MPTLYPDHTDFYYHEEKLQKAREKYKNYPCAKHLSEVVREELIFEESGMCIQRHPY